MPMSKSKPTKFLLVLLLLCCVEIALPGFAQSAPGTHYYLVLLKRPANAPQLTKEAGEKLQEEHMANIRQLYSEHKLVVAGPFLDDTPLRGIFVLKANSLDEAQGWANTDPAIKAGRLAAEIHGPWDIDESAVHQPDSTEGLQQYTLVLLNRSDKWDPVSPEFMNVVKQHHGYITPLIAAHKIAVAGPFPIEESGELRGVSIFCIGQEETAKLVQDDPAIRGGLMKPEIHPWATGTGVLAPGQPLK